MLCANLQFKNAFEYILNRSAPERFKLYLFGMIIFYHVPVNFIRCRLSLFE